MAGVDKDRSLLATCYLLLHVEEPHDGSAGPVLGALILFVVGGLIVGWFTPTEAASVGCVGALIIVALSRVDPYPVARRSRTRAS